MASDHRRAGELSREGGDGSEVPPSVSSAPFGITRGGAVVCRHTLTGGGLVARCLDYGGAVQALEVPDRQGQRENVLLGYDALKGYEGDDCWCGVLCGPLAGRVAGASFELEGKRYALEANDSSSCLHGGSRGFSRRIWRSETFVDGSAAGVRFSLDLSSEVEAFPGPRSVSATYTLSSGGVFSLLWEASGPEPLVLAPTFHGYFNLGGPACPSVAEHVLFLDADRYMPLDEGHLPCVPESVAGTPFDFRTPRLLEDFFRSEHPQILRGAGSDHAFLFRQASGGPQGILSHPESGRRLELFTDEPCAVVYSGGGLSSAAHFSAGRTGTPHLALALEPQWYPNALGLPELPAPVRPPGIWRSRSTWRFSVMPPVQHSAPKFP